MEPASVILTSVARLGAPGASLRDVTRTAAQAVTTLCTLKRPPANAEAAITVFLGLPLVGKCAPECCDASFVRWLQLRARLAAVRWLNGRDRAVAALSGDVMAELLSGRKVGLPLLELLTRLSNARETHRSALLAALDSPRWQARELGVRGLGRLNVVTPVERSAIDAARDDVHRRVRRAADGAWRRIGARGPRDVGVRVSTGAYRSYRYVGPEHIRRAALGQPEGVIVATPAELAAWSRANPDARDGATYVIDARGRLRLAPRRSEHVACAAGGAVLAAGEVFVAGARIVAITNQSTGYCPEAACWTAVCDTLAAAGIAAPLRWAHAFTFRRCSCGQINLVKERVFECAACGAALAERWNFG